MRCANPIGVSRLLLLGLASLNAPVLLADSTLRLSTAELSAENSAVVVVHRHDVRRNEEEQRPNGWIVLDVQSSLRITSKGDGAEVELPVMPLTALVNVRNSEYFVGLSNLKALSFEYNFVLFTQDGRIVTTALITSSSGHCRSVRESVTNSIRWFDENGPDVDLHFGNDVGEVHVRNPYDRGAGDEVGECVIRVGAPAPDGETP